MLVDRILIFRITASVMAGKENVLVAENILEIFSQRPKVLARAQSLANLFN